MKKFKGFLTFLILLALIGGTAATIIRFLPLKIELVGEETVTVEVNTEYVDAGAVNPSTGEIITGVSNVDVTKPGKYTVRYDGTLQKLKRTVIVADTTAPVITLNGSDIVKLVSGDTYTDAGATVTDNYDKELKAAVRSDVDPNKPGEYTVTYSAADSAGNKAVSVVRTVIVDSEVYSYERNITNKAKVDEKMVETITNLFNDYYRTLKYLQPQDLTKYFDDPGCQRAYMLQKSLELLTQTRKMNPNDLTLASCSYDLNIKSTASTDVPGVTKVVVLEDSYLNFNYNSSVQTTQKGLESDLYFKKVNGQWKLTSLYKEEAFYLTLYKPGKDIKTNYKAAIDQLASDYLTQFTAALENREQERKAVNDGLTYTPTTDKKYDREAAAAYARKYCLTSSPAPFRKFTNNCMNFANQCLNAGGIAMDNSGSGHGQQWKFFGNAVKTGDGTNGYVYSWTSISYFRSYLKSNKKDGPTVVQKVNMYLAQPGDLLLMGYEKGKYNHVVVVTDVIKDANGNVIDLLFCGSTNDQKDFPLSACAYLNQEMAKVEG
ncbi:MAG: DUF5011 domain-containing protein [Erysipelotrichaceae bacterium]|nr:DUF5011 domain-containing protein [Erysipelotrichaceae bacterium]